MKKINKACLSILLFSTGLNAVTAVDPFLDKYPGLIYQDLIIGKNIYPIGTDVCQSRYELLKPILNQLDRSFSLLDLGAAQGYFSFRVANDYPSSSCVMIEANNTSYYTHHGDMLYDLCQLNPELKNIFYIQNRVNLSDLSYLNQNEHFDVVIAFLVVHLMEKTLKEQAKIIEVLLELGDNLILEVANDVGVIHTTYVEYLSHKIECEYLGEVNRHKKPSSKSTGKLFWFKKTPSQPKTTNAFPIQRETFIQLGGVYPLD